MIGVCFLIYIVASLFPSSPYSVLLLLLILPITSSPRPVWINVIDVVVVDDDDVIDCDGFVDDNVDDV